jgi:pimeloyl-ACP methyl ester carboxylesterase
MTGMRFVKDSLMASLMSLVLDESKDLQGEELIRSRAPIGALTAKNRFGFEQKLYRQHVYMEAGNPQGTPIIFCHGIFGSFRNFAAVGEGLSKDYRIIVPCMPMYDAPFTKCTVNDLSLYLEEFINDLNLKNCILAGNSMGGGTVLLYTLRNPQNVSRLLLFASSGLSFIPMRGGMMKLKNFEYVKSLLSDIFYNTPPVSDEEFQEVFSLMQSKPVLLRIFNFTRSTKSNFLHEQLKALDHPALVIWGKNDTVTPPFIAEEFKSHLKNSELHYLDDCGHVPTYEKPEECLKLIRSFLEK